MSGIEISPAARDWILDQGGAMTLRISTHYGCCGGHAGVIKAFPGSPARPQDFERRQVDSVEVYLESGLETESDLRVSVEGFWRFRRLFVEGGELVGSQCDARAERDE